MAFLSPTNNIIALKERQSTDTSHRRSSTFNNVVAVEFMCYYLQCLDIRKGFWRVKNTAIAFSNDLLGNMWMPTGEPK